MYSLHGSTIVIERPYRETEFHRFDSEEEARLKMAFLEELHTWIGTPFRDCAAIKGKAADCASYQWAAAMEVGLIRDVPKPKYHPRWLVHRDRDLYVEFLLSLGAREVETPRIGDIHLYFWCRVFGHGAVRINSDQVIHAHGHGSSITISSTQDELLTWMNIHAAKIPRPVRYFDVWNR